jgi:probable rRNA maturation factor
VKITIRNLQRKVHVDLARLRKSLPKIAERVGEIKPDLAVLLVSDTRMAKLHHEFLHETGPTDVITFEHGEIFISVETARRNARRFGSSLGHEIQLYIIHGLLHLQGFDDRIARDATRMRRAQEKILRSLR